MLSVNVPGGPGGPPAAAPRDATRADLPAVRRLLHDAGLPDGDVPALFAHRAADFAVVDDDAGGLAAVAGLEVCGADALLRSVAVAPAARGRGTGVRLVRHLLGAARRRELRALYLLTTTAEGWFPRFGFAPVARDLVPGGVRATAEFRGACPASAAAMALGLGTRLRPATADDLAAVAAIYNAGIRERVATFETAEREPDALRAWLDDGRPFLVAVGDGVPGLAPVVGWARAGVYRTRPCYDGVGDYSVYVAPEARGRGAGDALLRGLVDASRAAGLWKLVGRIFPENAASLTLAERHRFRVVGTYERHARLDGAWRDVVVVERVFAKRDG